MHLQSILSKALLTTTNVISLNLQESGGKPSKLLQVGRYPALGCIYPRLPGLTADNTWNAYGCNINETVVLENAQFIKDSGLLVAGYKYIVIDGLFHMSF